MTMTIVLIVLILAIVIYWWLKSAHSKQTTDGTTAHPGIPPKCDFAKEHRKIDDQTDPIPRVMYNQSSKTGDPYLRCDCIINPSTAKKYLSFADTLKRKSEWEALGFKIRIDNHGNCKTARKYVSFRQTTSFNDVELEAIKTGKKYTTNPRDVLNLLNHGCSYADFASVAEDIQCYCKADGLFREGKLEQALTEIKKAIALRPKEPLYQDLSIEIRFSRSDISAIDEDISYHIDTYGDISSMIHCGRAERWMKLLYKLKEIRRANDFENVVTHLLDETIEKKKVFHKPQGVKYVVDGSEEAGEQLALTVHNNAVAFLEAKKEQFHICVMKLKERQTKKHKRAAV